MIDVFDEKSSWRAADVYLRKARIYVVSLRRNGERGWVHTPAAVLDKDVSDRELGGAVMADLVTVQPHVNCEPLDCHGNICS